MIESDACRNQSLLNTHLYCCSRASPCLAAALVPSSPSCGPASCWGAHSQRSGSKRHVVEVWRMKWCRPQQSRTTKQAQTQFGAPAWPSYNHTTVATAQPPVLLPHSGLVTLTSLVAVAIVVPIVAMGAAMATIRTTQLTIPAIATVSSSNSK